MVYYSFCIQFEYSFAVYKVYRSVLLILFIKYVNCESLDDITIFDTKNMFGMAYYHTTHTIYVYCAVCNNYMTFYIED